MIHVADERLVRLIAIGKKTTHRFPANRKIETGKLTWPKMAVGKTHKVYTQAPFGNGGNPNAKPLLEVIIEDFQPDVLGAITDEEARREGFASVDAYATYWDRIYCHKPLYFEKNRFHPVWVVTFKFKKTLPAGKKMIKKLEQQLTAKAKAKPGGK